MRAGWDKIGVTSICSMSTGKTTELEKSVHLSYSVPMQTYMSCPASLLYVCYLAAITLSYVEGSEVSFFSLISPWIIFFFLYGDISEDLSSITNETDSQDVGSLP